MWTKASGREHGKGTVNDLLAPVLAFAVITRAHELLLLLVD
jgi:hypothetical protein